MNFGRADRGGRAGGRAAHGCGAVAEAWAQTLKPETADLTNIEDCRDGDVYGLQPKIRTAAVRNRTWPRRDLRARGRSRVPVRLPAR